jgi:hypothetical protein
MKFAGTKEGGDMSLSPHAAPALSDYDGAPGSYRIGGATAAGVKPP